LNKSVLEVVSAEGFVEAIEACETDNRHFDLIILGHTIPRKDKERIISHIKERCPSRILALLRSDEGPVQGADRSVEATNPNVFLATVRAMIESESQSDHPKAS
jgi:hypothetical protein